MIKIIYSTVIGIISTILYFIFLVNFKYLWELSVAINFGFIVCLISYLNISEKGR